MFLLQRRIFRGKAVGVLHTPPSLWNIHVMPGGDRTCFFLMNTFITDVCSFVDVCCFVQVFYYVEFFRQAQVTMCLSRGVNVAFFQNCPFDVWCGIEDVL